MSNGGTIEGARGIIAAAERTDGRPPVSDQAILEAAQGKRELRVWRERPGDPASEAIAAGILSVGDAAELDLVVAPAFRGRGVGTAALSELLADAEGDVLAWAHGENPAADALLGRAGFTPVRSLLQLELDPKLLPRADSGDARGPLRIPTPAGLELRAFDPASESDAGAWVRANAAAFADHPEQGRITLDDFALMRAEPWFDPADLILLAETDTVPGADPEIAGSTWIKTVRGDDGVETELYAVGVRPERAGQGLGRLLLDVTLARMAQHDPQRVTLYVDGENTRAVDLYTRAGFTVRSRSAQWKRPAGGRPGVRMDA
ncbi:mycothiol synthase [Leucobacter luti]|uniref:mycothiol synthase n=1 Tax=Leucobacter luti TaxID=340320 RepID=UPI003D024C22